MQFLTDQVGRLERVDLRSVWPNEERDFTPWLKDHLDLLTETLELAIEDIEIEQDVGNYSADMIGKLEGSGKIIVIENQFEETDHDHLGKLLTYMSGRGASIGIWIAERFREEHIATLEYLNETTSNEGIALFGVELAVKRIGDSPPAPEFTLTVKPNEWQRKISQEPISETSKKREQLRLDFFTKVLDRYKELNPEWHKVKAQPYSWLYFSAKLPGRAGFYLGWAWKSLNGYHFATECIIDTGDVEQDEEYFRKLLQQRAEIEKQIGSKLNFLEPPSSKGYRIELSTPTGVPFTKLSEERRQEMVEWGAQSLVKLSTILAQYIEATNV